MSLRQINWINVISDKLDICSVTNLNFKSLFHRWTQDLALPLDPALQCHFRWMSQELLQVNLPRKLYWLWTCGFNCLYFIQCLISWSVLITIFFDHRFWCCFIKHTEVSLIHPRCFSVLFLYQYWSPSCLITGFDVVSSNIQRFLSLIPDVDLFDSQDNSSWGLCNLCWWKNIQTSGASSAATEFSSVFTWKLMYLYLGRSIRSKLISHECQLLELSLLAIKIFFFCQRQLDRSAVSLGRLVITTKGVLSLLNFLTRIKQGWPLPFW